ncbi:hypothetical protein ACULNC_08485 [Shigella flexneri]
MAEQIEEWRERCQGVASALAEQLEGGALSTLRLTVKKPAAGMTVADVRFVTSAVGGAMVGETVEGIARYPINLRVIRKAGAIVQALRQLQILTPMKQQMRSLADVADVKVSTGPSMLKTENARPDELDLYRCPRS